MESPTSRRGIGSRTEQAPVTLTYTYEVPLMEMSHD